MLIFINFNNTSELLKQLCHFFTYLTAYNGVTKRTTNACISELCSSKLRAMYVLEGIVEEEGLLLVCKGGSHIGGWVYKARQVSRNGDRERVRKIEGREEWTST